MKSKDFPTVAAGHIDTALEGLLFNWGIFLVSRQEMLKSVYGVEFRTVPVTLQARFSTATGIFSGRDLTAELKALMNVHFTTTAGN